MINVPDIVLRGTIALNFASILPFVLFFLYLSTGFIEEGLFRGLVSGLLMRRWGKTKRGVCAAALISSLLFGLAHIFNLFQRQYTPLASLTQILFGIFFGLFFHSLFLRTKSLAPGIFLHALVDFAGHLDQLIPGSLPPSEQIVSKTPMEALISIGITLPLFLYGLFLLRKVEPRGD
jgi:membrane protease YdiL (CAAX protease family)